MNIFIVNCFDTYEHRVDLLHESLINDSHTVKVLTSNFRHFEKRERVKPKNDFVFFKAEPYFKNMSCQRLHSHYRLAKDLFDYLDKEKNVDCLWVLVPPNCFVKQAIKYKKNHPNVKLIFDLIDLWPETLPIGVLKNFFPFTIWRNLRDDYLKEADFIVTECNLYQKKLGSILQGANTEVLYLARAFEPYIPHLNLSENRIGLCYLGSINNIIDIKTISEIISKFKTIKPVVFHIIGDGERREELINTCSSVGATVNFHGKVYDREEKQKIFDSCHFGLNIMKKSVCVGLTMKSMDYFEFGLPLINNIQGDTWEIVEKYNTGFNWTSDFKLDVYTNKLRWNTRKFYENNLTEKEFKQKVKSILNDLNRGW